MLVESFSGIRGIYNKGLDETIAKKYVLSFLKFIKPKKIVIGCDTRPSSEALKKAMLDVINCEIIDIGVNTTPAIELAVRVYNADGGIIITASHNEPEYNGFKFLDKTGAVLDPASIKEVIDNFHNFDSEIKNIPNKTIINNSDDLIEKYTDFVLEIIGEEGIQKIKELHPKIIIDSNGGTASIGIKQILEKLNIEVIEVNAKPGEFKRAVEPNQKSLSNLIPLVKKHNADFAAGFDCDADRVLFIDDEGDIVCGQYVLALVVDEILSQTDKKNVVITNDATSGVVKATAGKYNVETEEVEVGEINVVKKMYEKGSVVGGEGSNGGCIIPPSRCRDGIITLLIILRLMARKNKKLSVILDGFPEYYISKTDVKTDKNLVEVRKKLEEEFSEHEIRKTGDETGGLKVIFDDKSWLWFRTSKTEHSLFRIIANSDSEKKAEELLDKGEKAFHES